MAADSTLVRLRHSRPEIVADGERAAFIHPTTQLRYGLNSTGRFILEEVGETTVDELARHVAAAFDVGAAEAREAIDAFLRHLEELGIVELRGPADATAALRARYLELLRRALMNLIYPEHELRIERLERGDVPGELIARERALRDVRYSDERAFAALIAAKQNGDVWNGRPWRFSHTMVGMRRLEHLQWCAERVFEDDVAGDFLEAGVAQGGSSILLRGLQVAFGETERRTWLADSFEGLPVPAHEADEGYDFSEAKQPWLAFSQRVVEDNFRTYDLLSDNVRFLPGWFRDTLRDAPVDALAILRLDADLYESTREILTALYDRVSPGGFIVVDDYGAFTPCRRAVTEFREERGITEPLRAIDRMAVYWRKRAS